MNVDYKIFSKAVAHRLKIVLPDLIHEDQTGFMKERLIAENIRKLVDVMNFTKSKNIPAILVSIDFKKAFDRCDYDAIWSILKYFNFSERYTQHVQLLFKDFQLATTNNGFISDLFVPTRGLFQGNPIASFLFLLLIETLAIELRANKNIKGIKIGQIEYLLSQFADDLNLLLPYDKDVWVNVMYTLDRFEAATGMKVSYDKTTIYRLGSIRNSNTYFYSSRKIRWTNDSVKVLGVWLDADEYTMTQKNFDFLITHMENVAKTWEPRGLSLIGKITMIKLITSVFVCISTNGTSFAK